MQTPRSLHLWRVACRSRGDHPQADRERGANPPTQIWKLVSQGGHLCCMCIILTDRQTDCHETVSTQTDRVPVLPLHTDIGSGTRLSPLTQTDRHTDRQTDRVSWDCSYTDRQGCSTPTTHRYRVWHETFFSYTDWQTYRLSWACSFTDKTGYLSSYTGRCRSCTRLSSLTKTDSQRFLHITSLTSMTDFRVALGKTTFYINSHWSENWRLCFLLKISFCW